MSKKQMGFTLIEIVMVLVLLGILSAVAVPKYFDLRDQAEQKAMAATAAEFQARLNAGFADALLQGKACKEAREAGVNVASEAKESNSSTTYADYGDYKIVSFPAASTFANKGGTAKLKLARKTTGNGYGDNEKEFDIAVPQCSGDSASDAAS